MINVRNHIPTQSDSSAERTRALVTHFVKRCLSREERLVTMLYYGEALSFEEIAGVLDVPVERICEIHENVVTRVRTEFAPAVQQDATMVA